MEHGLNTDREIHGESEISLDPVNTFRCHRFVMTPVRKKFPPFRLSALPRGRRSLFFGRAALRAASSHHSDFRGRAQRVPTRPSCVAAPLPTVTAHGQSVRADAPRRSTDASPVIPYAPFVGIHLPPVTADAPSVRPHAPFVTANGLLDGTDASPVGSDAPSVGTEKWPFCPPEAVFTPPAPHLSHFGTLPPLNSQPSTLN